MTTQQNNGFNPTQQFPGAFGNQNNGTGQMPAPQQPQQPTNQGGAPAPQPQNHPPFPVQQNQGMPQPAPTPAPAPQPAQGFGQGFGQNGQGNNGYGNGFGQPQQPQGNFGGQQPQGSFGQQPVAPMPNMATVFGNVGNANFGLPDKFHTRGGRYYLLVNDFFMKMSRDSLPTIILEGTIIKAICDANGVTPDQPNYSGFRVSDKVGVAKKSSYDPAKKQYFENHAAGIYLSLTGTMPAQGPEGAQQMAAALGVGENGSQVPSPHIGTIIEITGQNRPTKAGGVFMDISFGKAPIQLNNYLQMITEQEANILRTDSLFCQKIAEAGIDLNGVNTGQG